MPAPRETLSGVGQGWRRAFTPIELPVFIAIIAEELNLIR
jgi:hypothetical protein